MHSSAMSLFYENTIDKGYSLLSLSPERVKKT